MGKRVRVKKLPTKAVKINQRELIATLCFYFPQYTLQDATKLPYQHVQLLIHTAQKIEAARMYNLTQIAAAPHTKKMVNVKKLSDYFKKLAGN